MAAPDDADDLLGEIYQGEIEPTLGLKSRMDFKPWLKPRKHYIRLHQWCHEARQLMRLIQTGDGGELRYLGLPGEDLLDIRVLKGVCQRAKITLKYLGFDSSLRSPQLNLSRHEVNSGDFIHQSSRVLGDRLEALANLDSTAYQIADKHAPFDIINLDLCDSLTAGAKDDEIPNLEALRTLCDIQLKRRGQPWLLFLTTRTLRDGLDVTTKGRLLNKLVQNIRDYDEFSEHLREELALAEESVIKEMSKMTLPDGEWFKAYVLAVAKWLLFYMAGQQNSVSVQLLPSYGYSVNPGQMDMASLAFLLSPRAAPRIDRSGLTKKRVSNQPAMDELELAKAIVGEIGKIVDIDEKLKNDSAMRQSMFEKCSRLLAPLRYDMKAYEKFALSD